MKSFSFLIKHTWVFLGFILLVSLILAPRPLSVTEPPLFNPGRGFSLAVLLSGGITYGIPLILASFFSNLLFLKHPLFVSAGLAFNNFLAMWLGATLIKKFCRNQNPALNPKDWFKFIGVILPICLCGRFALDTIPIKMIGEQYQLDWVHFYSHWLWVDALGIIVTVPFFLELVAFVKSREPLIELRPNLIPFLIGNLLGIFMFFDPHFDKYGLPYYLPFYLALVGMIGISYFGSPILVGFSVFIQCVWAAWGRNGIIFGLQPDSTQHLWDLRIFLFVLGIIIPVISYLFRRETQTSGLPPELALTISHDLQEPLRNVTQALEILNQKMALESEPEAKTYIEIAMDSSSRLRRMIRGALELTKIEFAPESTTEVDTGLLVKECWNSLCLQFQEIGAKLEVQPLPLVKGNSELIARVFQNLFSNAYKYRGKTPLVLTVSAKKQGKMAQFVVSDNGIGFDMKDSKRIFNPYQRLFSEIEIEGNGLGLSICQRIIELHGGELKAESAPGKGATFYFSLPLA